MSNKVVASASLFIENKIIHSLGKAGHIEDVVVCESHRGMKLGKMLIDKLVDISRTKGCYKTILDCVNDKIGFYEKSGFKVKGAQMALYLPGQQ